MNEDAMKGLKVIITGATGMVGKGVLLECLDHPQVSEVLCISRRSLEMEHPKLKELIHTDFSEFDSVADQLKGYNAAYLCMGVSSAGMKEDKFTVLTYDYTMALARVLAATDKNRTITYVSGSGTDSSEKGRSMWARVKGKTENDLLKLGFAQAYMFRPGAIIPLRGIKSSTKIYQFIYDYFMWLVLLLKRMAPSSVVNTTQIGLAMIQCSLKGYSKSVIEPSDILALNTNLPSHGSTEP